MLRLTKDEALVQALQTDWRQAEISTSNHAMLAYAEKLTLRPWDMTEQDVIELRNNSFTDAAILDIVQVTSLYAFANRLADGLGVEVEV